MWAIAMPLTAADPVETLFRRWDQTQREARSFVVEFTLTRKSVVTEEQQQFHGTLQWMRSAEGEMCAVYEARLVTGPAEPARRCSELLRGRTAYLLDHERKRAIKFELTDPDMLHFLGKYWNPFVLLLDAKTALKDCRLSITKQDEWYTYLHLQPQPGVRDRGLPAGFVQGRAVLTNKGIPQVPKDMPTQLWYSDGASEYTFEIRRWRLNASHAVQPRAFDKPEDRPGWVVIEWPPKIVE
jgi:hypothetical protein